MGKSLWILFFLIRKLSRNLQVSYLGSILVYLSLKPSLTGIPPSFQLWYRLHEVGLIIVELFMLKNTVEVFIRFIFEALQKGIMDWDQFFLLILSEIKRINNLNFPEILGGIKVNLFN